MDHSRDINFNENNASVKDKIKESQAKLNMKNTQVLNSSDKFKSSPKPAHKKIKSTQSSTINTWITKDMEKKKSEKRELPHTSNDNADGWLNHSNIFKSRDLTKVNSRSGSSTDHNQRKFFSPMSDVNSNEGHMERKKHRERHQQERVQSKEVVNSIDKKSKDLKYRSNGTVKNKSCTLKEGANVAHTDLTTMEHKVRKKFKRILTPPLSPISSLSRKFNKNISSPQTNTISKWLNKNNSSSNSFSSSSDDSAKEKLKKRKVMENNNYEPLEKENSSSINNQKKLKCDETGTKWTPEKSAEKYKNTTLHSMNCKTKQNRNDVAIKPIKNRNPMIDETSSMNSSRKLFDVSSSSSKTNLWLSKDVGRTSKAGEGQFLTKSTKQRRESREKRKRDKTSKKHELNVRKFNTREKHEETSQKKNKRERTPAQTLDDYVNKCVKEKLKHSSAENSQKKDKISKTRRSSDSFKKYGVIMPSIDEILKEQKDFAQYKNQIESYGEINEKVFELSFSVKDIKDNETIDVKNLLGCKHLSIDDIEEAFYKNLDYISDIFHGRKYSERHEMFFKDETKRNAEPKYSVKDLRCSTSTIVFSFEQKHHILTLLGKQFDPDDKWTLYFFQVLLPEFCLKVFMDTHNMSYDEAIQYLDKRPIVDE